MQQINMVKNLTQLIHYPPSPLSFSPSLIPPPPPFLTPPLLAHVPLVFSLVPSDTGALWEVSQGQGAGSAGRSTCAAAAHHHARTVVMVPTGGRRSTPAWMLVLLMVVHGQLKMAKSGHTPPVPAHFLVAICLLSCDLKPYFTVERLVCKR